MHRPRKFPRSSPLLLPYVAASVRARGDGMPRIYRVYPAGQVPRSVSPLRKPPIAQLGRLGGASL